MPQDRLTISDMSRLLAAGEVSSVELTQACLERIDAADKALNSFVSITTSSKSTFCRRGIVPTMKSQKK